MSDQITTKPFASQAQAGWAFANRQPWARRWARETGPYKRLPYKVRKKALKELATTKDHARAGELAEMLALKGTKLAPGVTRIQGDLCNVHGRWGSCRAAGYPAGPGAAKPSKAKPLPKVAPPKKGGKKAGGKKRAARGGGASKPKKTEAQKRQEQDAKRAEREAAQQAKRQEAEQAKRAERDRIMAEAGLGDQAGLAGALVDARDGNELSPANGKRLADMGLAEQARDGSYRLTAAGREVVNAAERGDAGRVRDTISEARDRRATQAERAAAAAARQAAPAKKPKAGGSKKPAPRAPRKAQPRRAGGGGAAPKLATPGGGGGGREQTEAQIPQALRAAVQTLSDGGDLDQPTIDALVRNGLARLDKNGKPYLTGQGLRILSRKSFAVFKDATGAYRWLARTTTAFEDRDGEVISVKALADSADSAAPRGPLRWWHAGNPDPLSDEQPWGAGVDLGWCDFAALHGRTLIESGTFKSAAIARAVAAKADQLELSPGFFHAIGEPDASGVFHHIRIFERSLVPTWAGRASNYYTGLKVQGGSMDDKKMKALKELGASDDVITALLADVQQTEKSADEQGVRYKAFDFFRALFTGEPIPTTKEDPAPAEPEPDPAAEALAEDPLATLKAELASLRAELATLKEGDAPPPAEAAPADAEAKADMPMDGEMMGEEEEAGGLTLSPDDLAAIGQAVASALEPLIGALGITQKLEGHLGELKTMMGGYVKQKDDEAAQRQDEIAALKASIDQQQAKLGELLGDQPRAAGYRPSQAADNTLEQLQNTVKGAQPGAFDDLVSQFFPGMLPG